MPEPFSTNCNSVLRYEELVRTRGRGRPNGLVPVDHHVDWNNAPSKYKIYLDAAQVPLPAPLNKQQLELGVPLARSTAGSSRSILLEEISEFLLLTSGILRRKLEVSWNVNIKSSIRHRSAVYARGMPSGGGLYPVEVYMVARSVPELAPGIYHYSVAHHALSRLRIGNFDSVISSAIDYPDAEDADLLFILSIRFWKNVFKYHNLGYQLALQDCGALLGSMEQTGYSLGWNAVVIYWFRDRLLASLLGLRLDEEAPLTVIAVRSNTAAIRAHGELRTAEIKKPPLPMLPQIEHRVYERSLKSCLSDLVLQTHRETVLETVARPAILPSLEPGIVNDAQRSMPVIKGDLRSLLRNRTTSMGRFRREPPLEKEVLEKVLAFGAHGCAYIADIYQGPAVLPSLALAVIAQNARGFPSGVYNYCFATSRLLPRKVPLLPAFMQAIYFLENYNLDQVSAVLVVIGKLRAALSGFGGRGLRVMNAEAGIFTQRTYLASTALSLGCGVVLGFDAQKIGGMVAADPETEIPLLLIFLGEQVKEAVAFDFNLY